MQTILIKAGRFTGFIFLLLIVVFNSPWKITCRHSYIAFMASSDGAMLTEGYTWAFSIMVSLLIIAGLITTFSGVIKERYKVLSSAVLLSSPFIAFLLLKFIEAYSGYVLGITFKECVV